MYKDLIRTLQKLKFILAIGRFYFIKRIFIHDMVTTCIKRDSVQAHVELRPPDIQDNLPASILYEYIPRSFQSLTKRKVRENAWPVEVGEPKIRFVEMESRRQGEGILVVFFEAGE